MVEMKKYKTMRRAVIILSVVLLVLIVLFAWVVGSLYQAFHAQYAPDEGVWYCDALKLTLSYESDTQQSCLVRGDETILCLISGHPQDKNIRIYAMKDVAEKDGIQIYSPGDLLFDFGCIQLETDYFVVRDALGEHYTFVRLG